MIFFIQSFGRFVSIYLITLIKNHAFLCISKIVLFNSILCRLESFRLRFQCEVAQFAEHFMNRAGSRSDDFIFVDRLNKLRFICVIGVMSEDKHIHHAVFIFISWIIVTSWVGLHIYVRTRLFLKRTLGLVIIWALNVCVQKRVYFNALIGGNVVHVHTLRVLLTECIRLIHVTGRCVLCFHFWHDYFCFAIILLLLNVLIMFIFLF